MPSGALLAGIIQQTLGDVLPDCLPAKEADSIQRLDLDRPVTATAGDAQHVALDLRKMFLAHLGAIRAGARILKHGIPIFGGEGRIRG
jgi:hypothetical protein